MIRVRRLVIWALLFFGGEAAAQFCPGLSPWVFTDVPSTHLFCTDITWMAQRGVTLGCVEIDATHRLYCPNDSVPRSQMAAFMHRLGDALFPTTCAAGQVMKWNGLAWSCANDNLGGSGGGGTVTSVGAGTGLQAVPNPIVGAGVLSVASSYRLPQACAANQLPKWNGATWICANDAIGGGGGTVTSLGAGSGITLAPNPIVAAGTISVDTTYVQRRVSVSCAPGSSIRAIAADGSVTCETDDAGAANAFVQGGNAFGATATLGTTDNQALRLRVYQDIGLRLEPTQADAPNGFNLKTPNLIGGSTINNASTATIGATIGGGGGDVAGIQRPNVVHDHYGTVGGGAGNRAGDPADPPADRAFATVSGGLGNSATGAYGSVGGGQNNSARDHGSVGGGEGNRAWGDWSVIGGGGTNSATQLFSTIAGGEGNDAFGDYSTVAGGLDNVASGGYSTVGGGAINEASGFSSTIPGGFANIASGSDSLAAGLNSDARGNRSIALGTRAKAYNGANVGHGAIVIADGNDHDFNIGTDNRFGVRATGGIYLALGIDANGAATFTCQASNGNAWACASDRNLKHSLFEIDGREVLEKLAAMPVYQWQPKGQNAHVKHYGPMAQDFYAAFGLGDNDTMIGMQDADGVALAAIQGLHQIVTEKNSRIEALETEIAQLRAMVQHLVLTVREATAAAR